MNTSIENLLGMTSLLIPAVLFFVLIIGFARLATLKERLRAKAAEIVRLSDELEVATQDREIQAQSAAEYRDLVSSLNTSLDHERSLFEEKLAMLSESKMQMTNEFKNIANDIMEEKSRSFTTLNKDSMASILSPLQDRISTFEEKITQSYDREARERFSLAKEIVGLQELNSKLSEDANNLASALKGDNKTQGSWGEVILESILEKSGLRKGKEFSVQLSKLALDGSTSRPDIVVHLPEQRDMIIDAKVSLKAYDAFYSSENPEAKTEYLKQHIKSIRNHVKKLADKTYQNIPELNCLDFVLLFMPVESAYSLAAEHDENLFNEAFGRNVIIVGPTTLMTTLRTVQNLWRLARQEKNAKAIADQAGSLYDKFVALIADLEEVGTRLNSARSSYQSVHSKLHTGRGNLVAKVENLKQLGARTSKKINQQLLDDPQSTLSEGEALAIEDAGTRPNQL